MKRPAWQDDLLAALATELAGPLRGVVERACDRSGVGFVQAHNFLNRSGKAEYRALKVAADGARDAAWNAAPKPVHVVAPVAPPRDPVEVERERMALLRLRTQERDALKAVAGERSLRAMLDKLTRDVAAVFPTPPAYVPPPAVKSGATIETLMLLLNDWHAYEEVSAERMRGFNEYDGRIFGQRAWRVVQSLLSIKQRMERGNGWRFPKLVVAANGDFVTGTIHGLERHTDAPNIVWAVYGCSRVLAAALRDLSPHFAEIEVFCTSGNHGRLPDDHRMPQKDPTRNWDTMVYLLAREALRDVPNVKFFIPNSYAVAFEVEGWRFLQQHGHDIKSWNQIPHYGINRAVSNMNALEASRDRNIHGFLFAHFHQKAAMEHPSGEWWIGPSLIGGNEFTMNALGKVDRPGQLLLGVHPENWVTHQWTLRANAPADAPGYPVAPWVEGVVAA